MPGAPGAKTGGARRRQGLCDGRISAAFDSSPRSGRNLLGFRQDNLAADYIQGRNACFEAGTLADLKRVAAAYIKQAQFTLVAVGQPALV